MYLDISAALAFPLYSLLDDFKSHGHGVITDGGQWACPLGLVGLNGMAGYHL